MASNTEPAWARRAADCRGILRDGSRYSTDGYAAMWRDLSGIPVFTNLETPTRSGLRSVIRHSFAGQKNRTEHFRMARRAIGDRLAQSGTPCAQDLMPLVREAQFACTLQVTGLDRGLALEALAVYREASTHIAACGHASAATQGWRDLAHEAADLVAAGSLEQAGQGSLLAELRSTEPHLASQYAGLLVGGFLDTLANSIDEDLPVTCTARVAETPAGTQLRLRKEQDARLAAFETVRLQPDKILVRTEARESRPGHLHVIDLSAADRDPAVFASPLEFNPWRSEIGRILGFGTGSHVCPARDLAVSLAAGVLVGLLDAGRLSSSAGNGTGDEHGHVMLSSWDA